MIEAVGFVTFAAVLFGGAAWFDRWQDRRRRQHAHKVRRLPAVRVEREDLATWALVLGLSVLVGALVPILMAWR